MSKGSEDTKEEMDWNEAQDKIEDRLNKTETLQFDFGESFIEFEVRGLKPAEYEKFEERASEIAQQKQVDAQQYQNINFRNEPETEGEEDVVHMAKTFFIKHGIVDGPEGFEATEEEVNELPPVIKTQLADAVDSLTNLGIETKQGF